MGWFDARRHAPLSIAAVYWHFVDSVWLAVFFTYYVSPHVV
jgi:heme/copper-type cytochrome/quinol oxidase subunit 3